MRAPTGNRYRSDNGSGAHPCNGRSSSLGRTLYGLTLGTLVCCVSGHAPKRPVSAVDRVREIPAERAGATRLPVTKVPALIVSTTGVTDVEELFRGGQTALRQNEPAKAAAAFDRIVEHDPEGPL